jgi:predicted nuclease with RNAse H fold
VDLGGGRGKNTAVARLELSVGPTGRPRLGVAEAKVRHGQRGTGRADEDPGTEAWFRDEALVAYLRRWTDDTTVVGINAPLTMPPCIRCELACPGVSACRVPVVGWMRRWGGRLLATGGRRDRSKPVVTPYTQRATELLTFAVGGQPRETLGQGSGPLAARAQYLRRVLSPRLRLHENLIEVHPRATLVRRFGEAVDGRLRGGADERIWATRKQVLAGLTEGIAFDYVWPEIVVRNTHVFNAVLCAFTAFLWSRASGDVTLSLRRGAAEVEADVLAQALDDLGQLWIEDGWIYTPSEGDGPSVASG